jgi:hypothetical protein
LLQGDFKEGLTDDIDEEGRPEFEEGRRRYRRPAAAVTMVGGALALGWQRELAEEMRLGVADFMAALASSPATPVRRLTRQPVTRSSGGGAACAC